MVRHLSRRAIVSHALFASGAMRLFAADQWQTQKYTDWDDKTLQKMLSDSPWSKRVSVALGPPSVGGPGGGGGGGRRGGGAMGGGGGMGGEGSAAPDVGSMGAGGPEVGGGGGGRGGNGGEMGGGGGAPVVTLVVRWMSALPIQQALARKANKELAAQPKLDGYVIGVLGLPGRFARGSGDPAQLDQFKKSLQAGTSLKIKGREPIHADAVEVVGSEQMAAVMFRFPKKEPISADDKEVEFLSRFGPLEVKAKFKTKDMMYDGALAV